MPESKHEETITRQDLMDEVKRLTDTLDRWRVKTETKVESHHQALFGNGKPGLDEEVRNINKILETLMRLAWIVVSSVVTVSVAGIVAVIVYLIKTIP